MEAWNVEPALNICEKVPIVIFPVMTGMLKYKYVQKSFVVLQNVLMELNLRIVKPDVLAIAEIYKFPCKVAKDAVWFGKFIKGFDLNAVFFAVDDCIYYEQDSGYCK